MTPKELADYIAVIAKAVGNLEKYAMSEQAWFTAHAALDIKNLLESQIKDMLGQEPNRATMELAKEHFIASELARQKK